MISTIILAAGESQRMGQPKMLLPWGDVTVIEHVVSTFLNAGLDHILVVTGGAQTQVGAVLNPYPVQQIQNNDYAAGEMLSSIQCGLRAIPETAFAALIALGDQPQVQEESIRLICNAFRESQSRLIVPSFNRKRGHPWLVTRPLWDEILGLQPPQTLRNFLNNHADEIHYVNLDTPSILADLDTPEDYRKSRP